MLSLHKFTIQVAENRGHPPKEELQEGFLLLPWSKGPIQNIQNIPHSSSAEQPLLCVLGQLLQKGT